MQPKNYERDIKIYEANRKGISASILAEINGISVSRVHQVIERQKRAEQNPDKDENELFAVIRNLPLDGITSVRAVNLLKRNNIYTLEELKSYTSAELRKRSGFGDRIVAAFRNANLTADAPVFSSVGLAPDIRELIELYQSLDENEKQNILSIMRKPV